MLLTPKVAPVDLVQSAWSNVLRSYSTTSVEILGTLLVQLLFFYIPVVAFSTLSAFAPKFSYRHQLQPQEKSPQPEDVLRCFCVVVFNQAMAVTLHMFLLEVIAWKSGYRFDENLPSLYELVGDVVSCMLLREVGNMESQSEIRRTHPVKRCYFTTLTAPCTAVSSTHAYTNSTISSPHHLH
jgi:hypothetical protein